MRPTSFDEFIGQSAAKDGLRLAVEAAKARGEMPDHILISGPPGLGKTTLASIVAQELGVEFKQSAGPAIGKPGDMAAILTVMLPSSVLFLDEIHRMSAPTSELLYTAMEDFAIDLMIGDGATSRSIRLELPRFTLIGATTRPGALPAPLLNRFGIEIRLDYYEPAEILAILERDASKTSLNVKPGALGLLAGRARGTPRVAKKLLRRIRDWAQIRNAGSIDDRVVRDCLAFIGIDELGLDKQDRRYLQYIIHKMQGRPVGIGTIAAALTEDPVTIETMVEPYLLKAGLIQRTPRGRIPSPLAIDRYAKELKAA